ncbi:MAG: EamA family transporter [Rhizobiales bacterium]|nr:EamA family transporter [Hyphomicrobiales bacterium]
MPDSFTRIIVASAPALFVVMWATGFIAARLAAPHVEPFTFLAIRFPLAAALFAGIAVVMKAPWPAPRLALHAGITGAFIHAIYLSTVFWAVSHGLPAGVSALIVGLQPLITAFIASALVGEEITPRHWFGLLVGVSGVGLVISPRLSLAAIDGITPATTLACLGGTLAIAFGTVYQKRFATTLHIASGGAWQYVGASIVMVLAVALFEEGRFDGSFNAWFALSWSVIVLSLGAISLLMLLIRHGEIARVSSLMFLVPAVAALMAYGLFGETLTLVQVAGMAVCAAAVVIVNRRRPAAS